MYLVGGVPRGRLKEEHPVCSAGAEVPATLPRERLREAACEVGGTPGAGPAVEAVGARRVREVAGGRPAAGKGARRVREVAGGRPAAGKGARKRGPRPSVSAQ